MKYDIKKNLKDVSSSSFRSIYLKPFLKSNTKVIQHKQGHNWVIL